MCACVRNSRWTHNGSPTDLNGLTATYDITRRKVTLMADSATREMTGIYSCELRMIGSTELEFKRDFNITVIALS